MADFSRKHYVAVAKIINEELASIAILTDSSKDTDATTVIGIAIKLAGLFGEDNPQFDWHRFYTACGLDANKLLSEEA